METHLSSSSPQSSCLPLPPQEPAPVSPAAHQPSRATTGGVGAWAREGGRSLYSNSIWLSDLIFLSLCPGFPGFTTPTSVSSFHLGEIGKVGMVISGTFFLFFGRQLLGPRGIIRTLDCKPGPCSPSWWGGGVLQLVFSDVKILIPITIGVLKKAPQTALEVNVHSLKGSLTHSPPPQTWHLLIYKRESKS